MPNADNPVKDGEISGEFRLEVLFVDYFYCISDYLPQVINAIATLSKSLSLKYLRFSL